MTGSGSACVLSLLTIILYGASNVVVCNNMHFT
jgi:hypothetical protein